MTAVKNAQPAKEVKEYIDKEELAALRKLSNIKATIHLVRCWLVIAAIFTLAAIFPNPITLLLAVLLLGGSQLSLGGLLHDCSHRAMFKRQWVNGVIGHWLGGVPVLVPMSFYRKYHFIHHTRTGENIDPDVGNIKNYPVTKASMTRKLIRDFTGQSGFKSLLGIFLYVNTGRAGNASSMGVNQSTLTSKGVFWCSLKNFSQILIFHSLFFGVFYLIDKPWLYGLWWIAYLFIYPFILRIRQIGEHGAMPQLSGQDVRLTTRTTLASWWEKLLFAPNKINYHCEHHLYPVVPAYNLEKLHRVLKRRGFYDAHPYALEPGYFSVIKRASSKLIQP
ncbi:fatty acid desaturase family protein [Spartinivicinus poritis]|uniref:Fatty acid desaturase family protein n=1 Tax=Spartinivicinus poritis TaxID=2994640 RepID=A0ABT5UAC7_9GAMM|nr:fatty acid desaturase family protein [Spartinivicinus sp. A2-2]MDE1462507.1 fatty acid desaturase family protein [Spartinivicinus sp. A2-2]